MQQYLDQIDCPVSDVVYSMRIPHYYNGQRTRFYFIFFIFLNLAIRGFCLEKNISTSLCDDAVIIIICNNNNVILCMQYINMRRAGIVYFIFHLQKDVRFVGLVS